MAAKFILSDVTATKGMKSNFYWNDAAITFLKNHMENVVWSAHPLEMFGESQALRLFNPNHKLLATMIIEKGLGLPSQNYTKKQSACAK